jgi:hypothetical protein
VTSALPLLRPLFSLPRDSNFVIGHVIRTVIRVLHFFACPLEECFIPRSGALAYVFHKCMPQAVAAQIFLGASSVLISIP